MKTVERLELLYNDLDKDLRLKRPYLYSREHRIVCDFKSHDSELYDAYWYHPDHLGSSSYITNTTGEISQHMEYLPFGETLVEEHLNSYNSPFKFNAKEYDAETGNYYYGARYYDPKWSMWLGVDPLAEKYPSWNPYNYTLNNPINLVDPDGRAPCPPGVNRADAVLNPIISDDNGGRNNNRIGSNRGHKGVDILAQKGGKVRAALGGVVTVINNHKSDEYTGYRREGIRKPPTTGLGNTVIIETILENDYTYTNSRGKKFKIKEGETLVMKYSHLDFGIEELDGQTIDAGTMIGESGATGNAGLFMGEWGINEDKRHVHVEARIGEQFGRVLDPEGFFKTKFDAKGNPIPNIPPPVDGSLEGNPKN